MVTETEKPPPSIPLEDEGGISSGTNWKFETVFWLTMIASVIVMIYFLMVAPVKAETASFYGGKHHGRLTASGQAFNMHAYTAASRTLKMGRTAKVTNLANGRSVVVRINDFGPAKWTGRSIDLSRAAFASIASLKSGVIRVGIR